MSAPTYGLFDIEHNAWLGDDNGPRTWDDEAIARCALSVLDVRMHPKGTATIAGKIVVREYDGSGTRMASEFTPELTTEEALALIEPEAA